MSQNTEKANDAADVERATITRLAESYLSSGQAKTKEEAKAKARLEIAQKKAHQASVKLKAIEDARKMIERKEAKKQRYIQSQNERKKRTKRLIEAGGIVAKAGLLDWSPELLLGALVGIGRMDENKFHPAWRSNGAKLLNKSPIKNDSSPAATAMDSPAPSAEIAPAPQAPEVRSVTVAVETPEGDPGPEIRKDLREAGLEWLDINYDRKAAGNELQKSWQGKIPADKIDVFRNWVQSWNGILKVFA